MKRTMVRTTLGIMLFVVLAGMASPVSAHSCSLASVAGEYGYTSNGTIVSPPVGPFATVGHVTFTASGTFSGAQTTSIAGNFFDGTVSGTYSVNHDCTGSAVVNVYHGTTSPAPSPKSGMGRQSEGNPRHFPDSRNCYNH
jgi:hypothetical protein